MYIQDINAGIKYISILHDSWIIIKYIQLVFSIQGRLSGKYTLCLQSFSLCIHTMRKGNNHKKLDI